MQLKLENDKTKDFKVVLLFCCLYIIICTWLYVFRL